MLTKYASLFSWTPLPPLSSPRSRCSVDGGGCYVTDSHIFFLDELRGRVLNGTASSPPGSSAAAASSSSAAATASNAKNAHSPLFGLVQVSGLTFSVVMD